jgi:phosphotransferase system IIB component
MDSIHNLTPEIQKRISTFERFLTREGMKRPEVKFTGAILTSMLKEHHVRLAVLARGLEEEISPKKTWERLSRHISKRGLHDKLTRSNIKNNKDKICRMRFCVVDLSDIQKAEAEEMEGLSRVRDGSKSAGSSKIVIGNGYYWLNGVMAEGEEILPVYSEIYSLDCEGKDHTSENSKILGITDMIHEVHREAIFVLDRGGDRSKLIEPMLSAGKLFVIRGDDQRSLRLHTDSMKATNIEVIAYRTKTPYQFKSKRNGEIFYVGIRRVYFGAKGMWLVVSRRHRDKNAVSWYLTNIPGSRNQVMETVMEAYGLRWRVEEYHRQIKQDYKLEQICLRKYSAIKNMCAIVMLAASFCARLPYQIVIKMLVATNQLPFKRLSDIPKYPYYMITAAVAQVMQYAFKRRPKPLRIRKRDYLQLNLNLGEV